MKYKFKIGRTSPKDGECYIEVLITHNYKKMLISTKKKTHTKFWDSSIERVIKKHPDWVSINQKIEQLDQIIKKYDTICSMDGVSPDLTKLKRLLGSKQPLPTTSETFNHFMLNEINNDNSLKIGTISQEKSTHKVLNEYKPNIPFNDINILFLKGFDTWARKRVGLVTIMKYHKHLRKYIKIAIANGLISDYPYGKKTEGKFEIEKQNSRRDYLTREELQSIIDLENLESHLERARDQFVCTCFIGLSIADIPQDFKPLRSIMTIDGKRKPCLKIPGRVKMYGKDEVFTIPLYPMALDILEKYDHKMPYTLKNHGDVTYNRYLKTIALAAGIKKRVTSNVARHTFATQMLEYGVPLETVSHMIGHRSLETTRHYARMLEEKIGRDVSAPFEEMQRTIMAKAEGAS